MLTSCHTTLGILDFEHSFVSSGSVVSFDEACCLRLQIDYLYIERMGTIDTFLKMSVICC